MSILIIPEQERPGCGIKKKWHLYRHPEQRSQTHRDKFQKFLTIYRSRGRSCGPTDYFMGSNHYILHRLKKHHRAMTVSGHIRDRLDQVVARGRRKMVGRGEHGFLNFMQN